MPIPLNSRNLQFRSRLLLRFESITCHLLQAATNKLRKLLSATLQSTVRLSPMLPSKRHATSTRAERTSFHRATNERSLWRRIFDPPCARAMRLGSGVQFPDKNI